MEESETTNPPSTTAEAPKDKDEKPELIEFKCGLCGMTEKCHYKGKRPPFAKKVQLQEDSYVMKDPFSPQPDSRMASIEYMIVLGADCLMCEQKVCKGSECSFFYSKTFCRTCLHENIKQFPIEIQPKIRKQLSL